MSHYNHGLHDNVDEDGNFRIDVFCRCDKCGFENFFRGSIKRDNPCEDCEYCNIQIEISEGHSDGNFCPNDMGQKCPKGIK